MRKHDAGCRCLSVIIPCFNEAATISDILRRVLRSPHVAEVIVVDDRSMDDSAALASASGDGRVRVLLQSENQGKGAALRRGFREATADFVLIQDADLEYSPDDYDKLLRPMLDDLADVVFGSRFLTGDARRVLYFWHYVGNRILTTASNVTTNLNLSDMETGYKVFRRDLLQKLDLEQDKFGIEPEITAKVARTGCRIYEVGISYAGRTYAEGKKIGWRDGFAALYCIIRYSAVGERLRVH
jgi:glycosyltransferase involved in cell wall biosynthesis